MKPYTKNSLIGNEFRINDKERQPFFFLNHYIRYTGWCFRLNTFILLIMSEPVYNLEAVCHKERQVWKQVTISIPDKLMFNIMC